MESRKRGCPVWSSRGLSGPKASRPAPSHAISSPTSATDPASLHAVIGPHIGDEDYEVGPAEVDQFLAVFGGEESLITRTTDGKASLHLDAALRHQLAAVGVHDARVGGAMGNVNTRKATTQYFSDRSSRFDKGYSTTGRFALIAWIPA